MEPTTKPDETAVHYTSVAGDESNLGTKSGVGGGAERCDGCGSDITHRNSDDEYLLLSPEPRSGGCGVVTDMVWPPEITRTHNFCGMKCLCKWALEQRSPYTGKPYAKNPANDAEAWLGNLPRHSAEVSDAGGKP